MVSKKSSRVYGLATTSSGGGVQFDARTGRLPDAAGKRLTRITFTTCPGSDLAIHHVRDARAGQEVDTHGMVADSWWRITCTDLPSRTFRLFRGAHSMSELLRRYGFQDASGCVNHKMATIHYAPRVATPKEQTLAVDLPDVAPELVDAIGIPQFYERSGVCWFATMCWCSIVNKDVNALVRARLPDADFVRLFDRVIYDRDAAEAFRKRLWETFTVGDDVTLPPEMDGRNGFTEFCVLCAHIGLPMWRLRERGGVLHLMDPRVTDMKGRSHTVPLPKESKDGIVEPHLLALRFQDGDHTGKFPILRRVEFRGRRYRLACLYMGQRKCGHQIGMASPNGDWRSWSIVDADRHKAGIGPDNIYFKGSRWIEEWWRAWGELVHVTKYGASTSQFCSINPHNPPNNSLDCFKGTYRGGGDAPHARTNSIDVLYTLCTDTACSASVV